MLKYVLLSTLCLLAILSKATSTDELDSYLALKFSNFSRWVESEGLDPSPRQTGPTHIVASNLNSKSDYYLRNHGVRDHSKSAHKVIARETDLKTFLKLSFISHGDMIFSGDYSAEGTVWNRDIIAQGAWNISIPGTWLWNVTVAFTPTSTGYINIDSYTHVVLDIYPDGQEVYFQNLWESTVLQKYEKVIKDAVFTSFRAMFRATALDHPIGDIYEQFFMKILTEEKWDNIVGVPPTL